ncbi:hypothetical protein N9515_08460 [Vicingaceae bacterium]|nr:hypothetical protein [Vicingaceae bacterium]MDB4061951.1 hypothetical protein [Vicingaceae bacterium]
MQKHSSQTLLLTASIDPNVSKTPLTVISNPNQRLKEYQENLKGILNSRIFKQIVFCENTQYPYDFKEEKQLASSLGAELEIISFLGSNYKIQKQGKGFGEGEIINTALEKSEVLSKAKDFYKLTGRIQVDNFKSIVSNCSHSNCFLLYQRNKPIVDTRLFKCDVSFYKEHLTKAYVEVEDLEGNYLEHEFFKALKGQSGVRNFSDYPKFNSLSGSTGISYKKGAFKYAIYQIMLKTGQLSIK